MTVRSYDTIVVGGGPGGTVAAAILAARGQETLLLESSDRIGGRARTYEGAEFGSAAELAAELNDRPRQTLGWMKPSEKMDELLR